MQPSGEENVSSNRARGSGHKPKQEVPPEHHETLFHHEGDKALAQVAQEVVESPSLDIFRSHLDMVLGPGRPVLTDPA